MRFLRGYAKVVICGVTVQALTLDKRLLKHLSACQLRKEVECELSDI